MTRDGSFGEPVSCWVSPEADPEVRTSVQGVDFGVDPGSAGREEE